MVRQRCPSYRQAEGVDCCLPLPPPLSSFFAAATSCSLPKKSRRRSRVVLRALLPLFLLNCAPHTRCRRFSKRAEQIKHAGSLRKRSHLELALSRLRRCSPTKTAAPTAAPATAAAPTSLALLDRREAFDEDLVIFHRTGATIGRVEEAGAGREGRSVRGDLQVFFFLRRRRTEIRGAECSLRRSQGRVFP